MDSQSPSSENRTASSRNSGVVSGDGGRTPPKPSGDRNQSSNADGSFSDDQEGISSFPPIFSGDEPRPLQTDFFRHCALFYAHLGPEEESERWATYLPEHLRPGNMEKPLEEMDEPELYGDKYWWLSQENSTQEPEQPSLNQSSDRIRYNRVQLLELREVMAVPENILKIKQEIEAECLGVNQITNCGETNDANVSMHSMKGAPQTGEKEKHEGSCHIANLHMRNLSLNEHTKKVGQLDSSPAEEQPKAKDCHLVYKRSQKKNMVANISANSIQVEPETGEKGKQEGFVSETKKEKKKRRVLTDERKLKKKITKKKKRAEKNRKLGVKRLKIQPLLKPKPVSHCRHYLKGRCHEGEKCKFSHDVQPLTKSMPCCHFARQSCMKGDDCPYDHDLSKYPCNKYVSTGFCPRGENCLFSHKVMPNQDPASTTGVTKPETKTSNPPASDSAQHHSQKPHFVFGARNQQADIPLAYDGFGSVMAENSKGNVPASKADQPVKVPRGFTFLSVGSPQHKVKPNQDPASATGVTKPETKMSNPPTTSDSTQRHSQKPHFVFGARNQQADISLTYNASGSVMAKNSKGNVPASNAAQPVKTPQGFTFLSVGSSRKDEQPVPTSTSADVIVSGMNSLPDSGKKNQPSLQTFGNSNKTVFGGDRKEAAVPSNPPALPNSAGVFVFGENSLNDHNEKNQPSLLQFGNHNKTVFGGNKKDMAVPSSPPASTNSASVFGFGKNSLHDQKKDQPSLLPSGNHNKAVFGGDKTDTNVPSNPAAAPNSAGVFVFRKNSSQDHSRSNQPSLLPFGNHHKAAFGGDKKDANVPSNAPASSTFSARLNSIMKKSSSSGKPSSLSTSASRSRPVKGSEANQNGSTGPVGGSEPVQSRANVYASAGANSAREDAGKIAQASLEKPLSAADVWEILYGKGK